MGIWRRSLLWTEAAGHPPHAPPSGDAEALPGVLVEAEALHDEVSEGRHARDPTHTCTAQTDNH